MKQRADYEPFYAEQQWAGPGWYFSDGVEAIGPYESERVAKAKAADRREMLEAPSLEVWQQAQKLPQAVPSEDPNGLTIELTFHRAGGGRMYLVFGSPYYVRKEAINVLKREQTFPIGDVAVVVAQALASDQVAACCEPLAHDLSAALRKHGL